MLMISKWKHRQNLNGKHQQLIFSDFIELETKIQYVLSIPFYANRSQWMLNTAPLKVGTPFTNPSSTGAKGHYKMELTVNDYLLAEEWLNCSMWLRPCFNVRNVTNNICRISCLFICLNLMKRTIFWNYNWYFYTGAHDSLFIQAM